MTGPRLADNKDVQHLSGYADILTDAIERFCGTLDEDTLQGLLSHVALVRLDRGGTLYRQGEPGTSMHIVLSGRLQVRVGMTDGSERILAYPQPGDAVGEMSMLTDAGRAATVVAVRDTTLAMLDRADFESLVGRHPRTFHNIVKMIIARLTGAQGHIARKQGTRTVMLAPLHRSADVATFACGLRHALLRFGSVLHLNSVTAAQRLGSADEENYGRMLDDCERAYDFVLLETNPTPSPWTRICYGYADRIAMLADAAMGPEITELERWMFDAVGADRSYADVELVLIHKHSALPKQTRNWLAPRQVKRHYHVRLSDDNSVARVARFLSDNAVGLVLAGGGARGFAHLGAIRALHECGVVVDAIGGASFGALAATGLARGLDDEQIFEELRNAFSYDDPLDDYTIPIVSLVRGEHLDQILESRLPMDIEDLWLPFFAVSSDLSANQVRVHERGPLWRAIRASISLPAILPPILENGHLLIDGGVLNNLPVDVMREKMGGPIVAVDLAVERGYGLDHAMVPSGSEYIKSRLMPGRRPIEAPTVSRVILQVTTMASRKEVERARKLADIYLNPPLGDFDFLDWGSMREIVDVGYHHSLPRVQDWLRRHPRHQNRAGFAAAWQRGLAT